MRLIKIIATFFLLVLGFNPTVAQNNNMEDVVYLKNGSIIRGIIIETVPNQTIKIQTKDRNVFVFKYDEIDKITREVLTQLDETEDDIEYKASGYINITEINFCPGVGDIDYGIARTKNEDISFGLRSINGYQFNEHLSLGIGIGIDKYKDATLLPISLDGRITFLKGKISPVFVANAGYAFGLNNAVGGVMINPQVGVKIHVTSSSAFVFNIGYKGQQQEIQFYQFPQIRSRNSFFHFLTISTGFLF